MAIKMVGWDVRRLMLVILAAHTLLHQQQQQQQPRLVLLADAADLKDEREEDVIEAIPPKNAGYGDLPLPFKCSSVMACKITMDASRVKSYDGADRNEIIVDITGSGKGYWSISRFNQGDLSPRLAPRRPFAQSNLGVLPGVNGFKAEDSKHFAVQAWKPHRNMGVVLASVAQNGQVWSDGEPFFYGTVAAVTQSSGYGYSLLNGRFEGQEGSSIDLTVGKAGIGEEANIDVAVAWFPYSEGWIGGYVDAPGARNWLAGWQQVGSHSPQLPADAQKIITYSEEGADIKLPGVKGHKDGMLFVTSTDPGNKNNGVNLAALLPTKTGWKMQMREDSDRNITWLAEKDQWMFAFLYVPYSTHRLIGGHVDGETGKVHHSAGKFEASRLSQGTYKITIDSVPKTDREGILLLQVADEVHGFSKLSPNCFLSYNHTNNGELIVESHGYTYNAEKQVDEFPFRDTGFYFMWVDFHHHLGHRDTGFQAAVPHTKDRFGVGFFLGLLVAVGMAVGAYAMMKHLYYSPPAPSMIALEDIGSSELEENLLSREIEDTDGYMTTG